ncbi:P-type Ca2+ transporter type 2C [Nematocida homosporus]|uniref:P-type Ca2+ transporter type 2C n=1 Tax=Nematocida homosporus TaxID=1912981 RepID=UPI002220249B|nr:P-type Ca2+ transporter type 2C [Nematocida homosporus]KAI5184605.1 P-type Ca2+ transporter type 2C [Nematocida homosporus]
MSNRVVRPDLVDNLKQIVTEIVKERNIDKVKDMGGVLKIEEMLLSMSDRDIIFGINDVSSDEDKTSWWVILKEQSQDKTLIYLSVLALLSIVGGIYEYLTQGKHGYIDGISILVAVVAMIGLGTVNEVRKQRSVAGLERSVAEISSKRVRDGKREMVGSRSLVVGDRVWVEVGDIVPADLMLVSGQDLWCDESVLTGESERVAKRAEDGDLFLVSGSAVVAGSGVGLVVGVGKESFRGRLASMLQEKDSKSRTPLQVKLDRLVSILALIGTGVAVLVFLGHLGRWYLYGSEKGVLGCLFEAVSLAAVAIPEGLPIAVSLSLVVASVHMYQNKALVRSMAKCEIMNSTSVICMDKTGTLTKGIMEVREVYCHGVVYPKMKEVPGVVLEEIFLGVLFNSRAFISATGINGSTTEVALLKALQEVKPLLDVHTQEREGRPFCSTRKYMSTYVAGSEVKEVRKQLGLSTTTPDEDTIQSEDTTQNENSGKSSGSDRVFFKGAPEIVLARCSAQLNGQGKVVPLLAEEMEWIKDQVKGECRFIALAYSESSDPELDNQDNLIFVALFAIVDELRPNIKSCIEACQTAGIQLKMVTGDGLVTAKAIGEKAGMVEPDDVFMAGESFRGLEEEEIARVIARVKILYRFTPEDKLRLIRILQSKGEVVAVTGDGSNDAPALKRADIGFAMGNGTGIAKRASDVILLDGNFASLVNGIAWGRCVNDNVRKFCQFQLALTLVVVVFSVVEIASGTDFLGLSTGRLLWLNVIGDSIAAVVLSLNKPTRDCLQRPPESLEQRLITKNMLIYIGAWFSLQAVLVLILYFLTGKSTFCFNTFGFVQIFGLISTNSLKFSVAEIRRCCLANKYTWIAIAIAGLIQTVLVGEFNTYLSPTFRLSLVEWISSVLVALGLHILYLTLANAYSRLGRTATPKSTSPTS